jgi:hypothetical protein
VKALLADINIQRQVEILITILESESWRNLWSPLNLSLRTFRDLGLALDVSDAVLWQVCQQEQLILITANRNHDGPDSLEAAIRAHNTPQSLPLFTIGRQQEIQHSKVYAERVAAQLLDYLLNIDRVRGTGRLYLP